MSTIQIKLLNESLWRDKPIFNVDKQKEFAVRALENNGYDVLPPTSSFRGGVYAAEEIFDLTNNPERDAERQLRYGNGRSVSSGDIINVDGVDYLCCSVGWEILS